MLQTGSRRGEEERYALKPTLQNPSKTQICNEGQHLSPLGWCGCLRGLLEIIGASAMKIYWNHLTEGLFVQRESRRTCFS